jgi:uncharacterized protein YuzB (UPF0349 family)
VRRVFFLLIVLGIPSAASADLQVLGYAPEKHDRFYQPVPNSSDPAKDFIGDGFDWSGVGRGYWSSLSTYGGWATMISEEHFLGSAHNTPPAGGTFTFFQGNNTATSWVGTIAGGTRIGVSDLWVGSFTSTPPAWVTRYPIIKRQNTTNWTSYLDTEIYIFGQTATTGASDIRLGRNQASKIEANGTIIQPGGGTSYVGPLVHWTYDTGLGGVGDDEAITAGGDSGGATFVVGPSGPALLSTHSAVARDTNASALLSQIEAALPSNESLYSVTDLLGDIDSDFDVDLTDLGLLASSLPTASGAAYWQGDLDGDGDVDITDLGILSANLDQTIFAPADFNKDQLVDQMDFAILADNWMSSTATQTDGDADSSGLVDRDDVLVFAANWHGDFASPPPPLIRISGDANFDGRVDPLDVLLTWANLHQSNFDPYTHGDVDGDGDVDIVDLGILNSEFGNLYADVNGDFLVDINDIDALVLNWHTFVTNNRFDGDINEDGFVDSIDLAQIGAFWHSYSPNAPSPPVPEPTTFGMATTVLLGLAALRRRK